MYSIQEQFKTDALAQMNNRVSDAQRIAGTILDLGREIGMLNIRTTSASAQQLGGAMQKLLGAGNPGEFLQLAASVMRPDMQIWTDYVAQLQGIAGKMSRPAGVSMPSPMAMLAPMAAAAATWPKTVADAVEAGVKATQAGAEAVLPDEAPLEAALAPAPDVPTPASIPSAAAPAEDSAPVLPAVVSTPAEAVEAIKEVAEAMTGAVKTPPVVMAASTLPPDPPAVSEVKAVAKSAAARSGRKPAPVPKKASGPARSAAGRARKG
jgi:hypothetical protein